MVFYRIAHAIVWVIYKIIFRFRVTGETVMPGGAVLCGNHTSLSDPVLVALAMSGRERPRFMAKKELFGIPLFGLLIKGLGAYPVRRGEPDLGAIKQSLTLLKSDRKILVFPWGKRVKDGDSSDIKNGAAMLANRSGKPIIPLYLSVGRKVFVNRIDIRFGAPMSASVSADAPKNEQYAAIADSVMAEVERLGTEVAALRARRKKRA